MLSCVDRILPLDLMRLADRLAVEENPANERRAAGATSHGRLTLVSARRWQPGRTLRVRFLDGSPVMHRKVMTHAATWTEHANIHFDFGDHPSAEVRISFYADMGSWSALGTEALVQEYYPRHQPTMNLGWVRDDTSQEACARVVLHEVGHLLGAVHEHQSPLGGIEWDEEAVYRHFSGPPSFWSREEIRRNVIERYSADLLVASSFDPESIMLYAFPPSLTKNGIGTRTNGTLSSADIALIRRAYPA